MLPPLKCIMLIASAILISAGMTGCKSKQSRSTAGHASVSQEEMVKNGSQARSPKLLPPGPSQSVSPAETHFGAGRAGVSGPQLPLPAPPAE